MSYKPLPDGPRRDRILLVKALRRACKFDAHLKWLRSLKPEWKHPHTGHSRDECIRLSATTKERELVAAGVYHRYVHHKGSQPMLNFDNGCYVSVCLTPGRPERVRFNVSHTELHRRGFDPSVIVTPGRRFNLSTLIRDHHDQTHRS